MLLNYKNSYERPKKLYIMDFEKLPVVVHILYVGHLRYRHYWPTSLVCVFCFKCRYFTGYNSNLLSFVNCGC